MIGIRLNMNFKSKLVMPVLVGALVLLTEGGEGICHLQGSYKWEIM